MRRLILSGLVVAALVLVAAVANAAPPTVLPLHATPAGLNFGTAPVGSMVIKGVTLTNRTDETMYYTNATWPNFSNPTLTWPGGFWDVDPAWPANPAPFHCWTIAPHSSCMEYFAFTPVATGELTATFNIAYSTSPNDVWPSYCGEFGTCSVSNDVLMRGTGK